MKRHAIAGLFLCGFASETAGVADGPRADFTIFSMYGALRGMLVF